MYKICVLNFIFGLEKRGYYKAVLEERERKERDIPTGESDSRSQRYIHADVYYMRVPCAYAVERRLFTFSVYTLATLQFYRFLPVYMYFTSAYKLTSEV